MDANTRHTRFVAYFICLCSFESSLSTHLIDFLFSSFTFIYMYILFFKINPSKCTHFSLLHLGIFQMQKREKK